MAKKSMVVKATKKTKTFQHKLIIVVEFAVDHMVI